MNQRVIGTCKDCEHLSSCKISERRESPDWGCWDWTQKVRDVILKDPSSRLFDLHKNSPELLERYELIEDDFLESRIDPELKNTTVSLISKVSELIFLIFIPKLKKYAFIISSGIEEIEEGQE